MCQNCNIVTVKFENGSKVVESVVESVVVREVMHIVSKTKFQFVSLEWMMWKLMKVVCDGGVCMVEECVVEGCVCVCGRGVHYHS